VTKKELSDLIENLENGNSVDLNNLESLIREYPYFQTLHILSAKIASDLDNENKNELIGRAAIHTSDRGNLKNLIENNLVIPKKDPVESAKEEPQEEIKEPEKTDAKEEPEQITAELPAAEDEPADEIIAENTDPKSSQGSSGLFQEVMQNLETLKSLRKKYEFLEEIVEDTNPEKEDSNEKDKSEKSRKPKKKEKKKATKSVISEEKSDKDTESGKTLLSSYEEVPFKKIDLNEQSLLIESFIKKESEFSNKKPKLDSENKKDLSQPSTTIKDDLISENLAEIMVGQGKREKAIDIYKKLIWKFPQKKSYFASRIEEITNN